MASGVLVGRGYVSIRPEFEGNWRRSVAAQGASAGKVFAGAFGKVLSSAAVPIAAVGASAGAAMASSFAAAGAGAGAFAAAVKPQLKLMTENADAAKKLADAQETAARKKALADELSAKGSSLAKKAETAATSAKLAALDAQKAYDRQTAGMPKATAQAALSLAKLKVEYEGWSNGLASTTMPLFTRGINLLRDALPKLTPLVKSTAGAFSGFLDDLGKGQSGQVFAQFGRNMERLSGPSLTSFLNMAKNMATGFVGILNAFAPMSRGVTSGLEGLTQKFASFGAGLAGSSGFQKFMDYVRQNAPVVLSTIGNIASTVGRLVVALAPLGGVTLKVVSIFAELVSLIPTPVLEALVNVLAVGVVGMKLFALYTGIVAAATRAWAAAQAIWNAVMNANPILRIVTIVIALGAALVLAYQKVGWFRTAVQAAWAGIKMAALVVWNSVLKPLFSGLMTVVRAVGAVFMWLWNNVIGPVFRGIGAIISVWWNVVVKPLFALVRAYVRVVAAVFTWLWRNIIGPVFRGIGAVIRFFWNVAKAVFLTAVAFVRNVLGPIFRWLYNTIVKPVFARIRIATSLMWAAMKIVFARIMAFIRSTLGPVFRWLLNSIIKPVWNGIKAAISAVWNRGIKPAFTAVRAGVKAVGTAFSRAKDAIKTAWDKLKGIAKAPVNFIINTVYTKGIKRVWDKVVGAFGGKALPKVSGLARGGILPGTSSFRQGDDQMVPMRRGEGVYVSEAMRDPYERARLFAVNKAAMRGRSLAQYQGFARGGVVGGGFAKGGIFDSIGKVASGAWDKIKAGAKWLKDGIKASALSGFDSIVKPLMNKASGSGTLYRELITRVPKKIVDLVLGYAGKADKRLESMGLGGPGVKGALAWAKRQAGKPYRWGGAGPGGYDCSGFMGAIQLKIMGKNPYRRVWATGAFPPGTSGWSRNAKAPFRVGITNRGVGHTAGTLAGINVESRGGDGVVVGRRARGANSAMFSSRWGFMPSRKYDAGGWLQPGTTAAVNHTGRPEAILTAQQWRTMTAAAAGGDGASSGPGEFSGNLYLEGGEFLGKVRGVVRQENAAVVSALGARAGRG